MTFRKSAFVSILVSFLMLAGCASQQGGGGGNQTAGHTETSASTASGPPVAIQKVIPFDNQAGVRLAVKKQCRLQTKVPKFVEQFGPEYGVNIQRVEDLDASNASRSLSW